MTASFIMVLLKYEKEATLCPNLFFNLNETWWVVIFLFDFALYKNTVYGF